MRVQHGMGFEVHDRRDEFGGCVDLGGNREEEKQKKG